MHRILFIWIASIFLTPWAFAASPVTLSGPVPALASNYAVGVTQVIIYTVTNHVPGHALPLSITLTGNSNSMRRVPVIGDCGATLSPAIDFSHPYTCNIGIEITPTADELGSTVIETLNVFYGGRCPIESTISFEVRQAFAFVANRGNNSYSSCPRNLDGSLQTCTEHDDSSFVSPSDIIVSSVLNKAWVMNNGINSLGPYYLSLCPINIETGALLDSCTIINSSSFSFGLSGLHPNHGYMYLSNSNNNTVSICTVNLDGSFGTCVTSNGEGTFNRPNGRIGFTNDGHRAYIPNYGNSTVSICTVDPDGTFSNCIASLDGTFNGPGGIDLSTDDKNLYVTNLGNSTVSICPINNDGSLSACTASNGNGTFNFNFVGGADIVNLFITTSMGYIPNQGNNTISVCPINPDGSFGTCTNNAPGPFNITESVWIN